MKTSVVFLILTTPLLVTSFGCRPIPRQVRLSKSRIEKIINRNYPLTRKNALGKITLHSPTVYFTQNNRIGTVVAYRGTFMGISLQGSVNFNGTVYYNKNNFSFYLAKIEILDISINNSQFSNRSNFSKFILDIVSHVVEKYPMYRLDPNDFRQNLAKIYLKEVRIKGERLVLILEK